MIRAVVFDLYSTLIPSGGTERDTVYADMARSLGVDPEAFKALFKQTEPQRMRGEFGSLDETMRMLAARLNSKPPDSQIELALLTWQRFHHRILWPSDFTLTTLDALRGALRLRLGLVSNCSEETPIQWPKQPMASRFQATVFSCSIGVLKPEPAIYHSICAELGIGPAECVYVGDGSDNELAGARSVGMRVIRTLEFSNSDPSWKGESINALGELIGRLA